MAIYPEKLAKVLKSIFSPAPTKEDIRRATEFNLNLREDIEHLDNLSNQFRENLQKAKDDIGRPLNPFMYTLCSRPLEEYFKAEVEGSIIVTDYSELETKVMADMYRTLQAGRVREFLNLIEKNPSLPILPMVHYETCLGQEFLYWAGAWGEASIEEYVHLENEICFKSFDYDRLVDQALDTILDIRAVREETGLTSIDSLEVEARKQVDSLDWVKVIVVYIRPRLGDDII